MADIDNPVKLTPQLQQLVDAKRADPAFSFKCWGDEDLAPVRSFIRAYYRQVQRGKCAYCRRLLSGTSAANCNVEHLLSKSLYPAFIFEPKNLCAVCAECNNVKKAREVHNGPVDALNKAKAIRYPKTGASFKVVHPHFDVYEDHILVLKKKFYVSMSPKGSFTIDTCDLNAEVRKYGWKRDFIDEKAARSAAKRLLASTSSQESAAAMLELQDVILDV